MVDKAQLRKSLRDPKALQELLGSQFARYEIQATLGKGGSAIVFRAKHRELGSPAALKLLLSEDSNPDAVVRFKREGQVLAQIKHKNVVGVSDLGEEQGIYYLAMELIEGENLYRVVRGPGGQPLEPAEAVEIGAQMARALAYCHQHGAVHRDVKPNNILMEHGTRRPVLTDFGLVKREGPRLGGDATAATLAGMVMGTPGFMAPEQFEPNGPYGKVGQKTDVWGLGATIYFLLTGKPPFDQANVVDLYTAVTSNDPVPPGVHRPGIPRALDEVVMSCFRKQVDDRPTMSELAERLEHLQGGLTREGSRRGIKHAAAVIAFFAALVALDLLVLEPERGRQLVRSLRGEGTPPLTAPPDQPADPGQAPLAQPDPQPDGGAAPGPGEADIPQLKQQAQAGDDRAMVSLGVALLNGTGVTKDPVEAANWFRKAAAKQNARAMLWLGYVYEKGVGLPDGKADPGQALEWYAQALDSDDPQVVERAREGAARTRR